MASGGVNSWPDYMQYMHSFWLSDEDADTVDGDPANRTPDFNMDADIATARLANPYGSVSAFDPDAILTQIETEFDAMKVQIAALSPEADFESAVDSALGKASGEEPGVESLPSISLSSQIDDAATAYENKLAPGFLRSSGRAAATYWEANAVQTTGFMFALMALERQNQDKVTDYRDKLRTAFEEANLRYLIEGHLQTQRLEAETNVVVYRQKLRFAYAGAAEILRSTLAKTMLYVETVVKRDQTGKTRIVAGKEQNDMQTALDVKGTTWNLDLYAYGGNLLAAQSGGVYHTAADAAWWEKATSLVFGGASQASDLYDLTKEVIGDIGKLFD